MKMNFLSFLRTLSTRSVLITLFLAVCMGVGVTQVFAGQYGMMLRHTECLGGWGVHASYMASLDCKIDQPVENEMQQLGNTYTFEGSHLVNISDRGGAGCVIDTTPGQRYYNSSPSVYWCPKMSDIAPYSCSASSFNLDPAPGVIEVQNRNGIDWCYWRTTSQEQGQAFWEEIDQVQFFMNLKFRDSFSTDHFDPQTNDSYNYPLGVTPRISTSFFDEDGSRIMKSDVSYDYTYPVNISALGNDIRGRIMTGQSLVLSAYPMYYRSGPVIKGQPEDQWKGGVNWSDIAQYVYIEDPNNAPEAILYEVYPTRFSDGYRSGTQGVTVTQGTNVSLAALGEDPDGDDIDIYRWQTNDGWNGSWRTVNSRSHPFATVQVGTYGSGVHSDLIGERSGQLFIDTSGIAPGDYSFRSVVYDEYFKPSINYPQFIITVQEAAAATLTLRYDDGSQACTGTVLPDSPSSIAISRDDTIDIVACDENDANVTGLATWNITTSNGAISMLPSAAVDNTANVRVITGSSGGLDTLQVDHNTVSDSVDIDVSAPVVPASLTLRYDDGSQTCTGAVLPDSPSSVAISRDDTMDIVACDENNINVTGLATWTIATSNGAISMLPVGAVDNTANVRVITGIAGGVDTLQVDHNTSDSVDIDVSAPAPLGVNLTATPTRRTLAPGQELGVLTGNIELEWLITGGDGTVTCTGSCDSGVETCGSWTNVPVKNTQPSNTENVAISGLTNASTIFAIECRDDTGASVLDTAPFTVGCNLGTCNSSTCNSASIITSQYNGNCGGCTNNGDCAVSSDDRPPYQEDIP